MRLLLIDSSSKKIEFGYADENELIIKEELDSNHNADTLTYFIKKSFDERGIDFGKIRYVSLSNGPGSFTGLRISSAIAKGICFAKESSLIEVSTLDIIAKKAESEFSEIAIFSEFKDRKIISLIFSNTKTNEFYYAEYKFESGKMKRISDYKVDTLFGILSEDCLFVINEKLIEDIETKFERRFINVSRKSNIESQYELTKEFIQKKIFADYKTSKPFYMKEFIPNI